MDEQKIVLENNFISKTKTVYSDCSVRIVYFYILVQYRTRPDFNKLCLMSLWTSSKFCCCSIANSIR